MKKILLITVVLTSLTLLYAVDTAPTEWKSGDTKNTFSFQAVFDGDEYTECGFSRASTAFVKGQGLSKSAFDGSTTTLTLVERVTSGSEDYYKYKNGSPVYVYWYVSVKDRALDLKLSVNVTNPEIKDKSGNVTAKANEVTVTGYPYKDGVRQETAFSISGTDSASTAVSSFSASPRSYYGETELTINSSVHQFPKENGVIARLKLTMETN